jgi:hypothetical protein
MKKQMKQAPGATREKKNDAARIADDLHRRDPGAATVRAMRDANARGELIPSNAITLRMMKDDLRLRNDQTLRHWYALAAIGGLLFHDPEGAPMADKIGLMLATLFWQRPREIARVTYTAWEDMNAHSACAWLNRFWKLYPEGDERVTPCEVTPASDSPHTPGTWFILSGNAERVNIANTIECDWLDPEHYVGEVTARNANIIKHAPRLRKNDRCWYCGAEHGMGGRNVSADDILSQVDLERGWIIEPGVNNNSVGDIVCPECAQDARGKPGAKSEPVKSAKKAKK